MLSKEERGIFNSLVDGIHKLHLTEQSWFSSDQARWQVTANLTFQIWIMKRVEGLD
jgi:hypothetical protein